MRRVYNAHGRRMRTLTSRSNRSGPRWGRRALGALGCAALVLAVGNRRAHGADVAVSGPSECADANAITEQVSDILGRRLAELPGIDFEITLARRGSTWHLRLDALEADKGGGPPVRRSRELQAATCAELVDAAAVGIAMSVRALTESERPAPAPPDAIALPPRPAPSPPPPPSDVARPTTTSRLALAGRLAVVGDAGALPAPAIGIELGAVLALRWVRIGLSGTALAPRDAQTAGGAGGEVDLIDGALEILRTRQRRPPSAVRLRRIRARPAVRGRDWDHAATARHRPLGGGAGGAGGGFPVGPRLVLAIRAGAGVPLSRPQFVINGSTPVHRPAPVVARAAAGVELEF